MNRRVLLVAFAIESVFFTGRARADVSVYLAPTGTRAVDTKGVSHNGNNYPRKHPPWLDDVVSAPAPDYPFWERAKHHTGAGWFQLALDLRTGAVTQVTVIKSTGFTALDRSTVSALRRWHWKPGKWREIYMPVTFTIASPLPRRPNGSTPLPRS
jgi:TonB family protein